MAFRQVRPRWSLFRPWAFGESGNSAKLGTPLDSAELLTPSTENYSQSIPGVLRNDSISLDNVFAPGPLPLPPIPLSTPESILNVEEPLTSVPLKDSQFPWLPTEVSYPVTLNHLLPQTSPPKFRAKKQRPKKFQCPHCQVSFSNNGQLKGHIRIHTGERPFRCDHPSCNKTFTRNEELTRHKRIHTGLRPHACPRCGKRFGRKDHLKKHFRTHLKSSSHPFHQPNQGLAAFLRDWIAWF